MKEGIQAIIQKINADAEQHASARYMQIKNEIDENAAEEIRIYSDELAKRREMLKKHGEHEYARQIERISSRLNREVLTYQHGLIDEIFDMAAEKLKNIPKEELLGMFKSVIKDLKGRYRLHPGELSKGKLGEKDIKKAIEESGNADIEVISSGEAIPHKSGFVLSDERLEYNCLFEDLIQDKKNGQTAPIMKEVFGNEAER
ncbi:MAG: hypothetical protein FWG34_14340 [Oscillospiraceae bacterium]|jgi:vacuolar-type H+-ATPase subunit E/Vma4|nr:hypothetical protein [Oscillospiraceae bacterium]